MKRRPALFRSSVDRILLEVQQVMRNKDYHRGMELLERAARLDPANTNILLHLGRIYGEHNDYATAERYFEQALRVSSNRTETLALIGDHCQNFHSLKLADKYLALAVQQKDVTPEILAEQAELCERLRRMEEASELVERALDLNRNCAPALLVAARLERQAGRLEAAEKLLVAFPENALPLIRMRACYELGTVLDRQGRYDEAMAAFTKAKWIWRPFASGRIKELAAMRTRMNELFEKATADVLKQWFDFSPQLQPHYRLALLGGHPRSGTTLLEQVLDSHPDMVSAEEFEIFLDDAYGPLLRSRFNANAKTSNFELLNTSTPAELQKSRQAYFDSMELALGQPIGGRLLIDKNPSQTFLAPALIRIFPEVKFLVALRDPRDVVLSCYMQNFPNNPTGAAFLTLESGAAEYASLMGFWQTVASRMSNPHLEVRYEDMVEDLESVARKTLDFLGVAWDPKVLGFDEHARKKAVRSPTYADVTQPVYKRARGRWLNYQKYLEPHLEKLEPFVKAFGYE